MVCCIYSILRNAKNLNNNILFKCVNVTNKILQVLYQIGLLSLCNQTKPVEITRDDVMFWRFCCGRQAIGNKFDNVVPLDDRFSRIPSDADLYGACIEATNNVARHAYCEKNSIIQVAHQKEAWWCFSQIKNNKLVVIVCDLGVTIPYTLPKNMPDLTSFLQKKNFYELSDSQMIFSAIQYSRSRTENLNRGNGLNKIAEIAKIKNGMVSIQSRHGSVTCSENSGYYNRDFKVPIFGTIIYWSLPLGDDLS